MALSHRWRNTELLCDESTLNTLCAGIEFRMQLSLLEGLAYSFSRSTRFA